MPITDPISVYPWWLTTFKDESVYGPWIRFIKRPHPYLDSPVFAFGRPCRDPKQRPLWPDFHSESFLK